MNKFKFHMQEKLNQLRIKLETLNLTISTLPPKNKIKIEDYGNKQELKKQFLKEHPSNFLKIMIGPTKEELQTFLRTKELEELNSQKNKLQEEISELEKAISSIEENKMTSTLDKSNTVIRELLEHALNSNLKAEETTKLLLTIIRNTNKSNHVVSNIKQGLKEFYDEQDNIKENVNLNTLRLIYNKLFQVILTPEEQQKYAIIIDGLVIEVRLNDKEHTTEAKREELRIRKENLEKLQTYILFGRILNVPEDMEEFKKIVYASGLDSQTAESFIIAMQKEKDARTLSEEEKKTNEMLSRYLTEDEMLKIEMSKQLEREHTGDIKNLIIRVRNDVISICKYMDMIKDSMDINDSLEVLTKRQLVLSDLVTRLSSVNTKLSNFYYLADDELIPYILRTIESTDVTELSSIYHLLNKLTDKKHQGTLYSIQSGINIYRIKNQTYTLFFTRKNNDILIINTMANRNITKESCKLTKPQLKRIREFQERKPNPEYDKLNATYEELVVTALNLNGPEMRLTLNK